MPFLYSFAEEQFYMKKISVSKNQNAWVFSLVSDTLLVCKSYLENLGSNDG